MSRRKSENVAFDLSRTVESLEVAFMLLWEEFFARHIGSDGPGPGTPSHLLVYLRECRNALFCDDLYKRTR
jgi:hypothetical protein